MWYEKLLEKDLIPEFILRRAINMLNRGRLKKESGKSEEEKQNKVNALVDRLSNSPLAVNTDDANEQHYELPPEFFELVLGGYNKYSCAYYRNEKVSLTEAEHDMLELTCERAGLSDGMQILELGCGWGSLTLFMAEKYRHSAITAVSNSKPQRLYIEKHLREKNLKNVKVITADMNDFRTTKKFDRIVSIEMFEHMRNYAELFRRIAGWLKPDGRVFSHIFSHIDLAYTFELDGDDDFMARYFFTGGTMPSDHLFYYFADDLQVEKHWRVDGTHYQRTSEDWLKNMKRNKRQIMQIFIETYGPENARKWFAFWKIFFIAVAEFFGLDNGRQWIVSHYLFKKQALKGISRKTEGRTTGSTQKGRKSIK